MFADYNALGRPTLKNLGLWETRNNEQSSSAKLKAQNAKLQLKAKSETFLFSFKLYALALRFTLYVLSLKIILHFEFYFLPRRQTEIT